jgi:YHS domain-containing protein
VIFKLPSNKKRMKNQLFLAVLILFGIGIVSQTKAQNEDLSDHSNVSGENKLGLSGYDPVSYFQDGPKKGNAKYSESHHGITYYFVSEKNKEEFEASPDAYAPSYGGWCAYGMAKGGKYSANPETYKIVNDLLFVYYNDGSKNTLPLWEEENEEKLVENADSNWTKVLKE